MKMTVKLKQWLRANCGLERTASPAELQDALVKSLSNGKLTTTKYASLSEDPASAGASEFKTMLGKLAKAVESLSEQPQRKTTRKVATTKGSGSDCVTKPMKKKPPKKEEPPKGTRPASKATTVKTGAGKVTVKDTSPQWHKTIKRMMGVEPPVDRHGEPRIKGAWERYADTKSAMVYPDRGRKSAHPLAGRPVQDFSENGRTINSPSDLDKAVAGAYAKFVFATAQRGGSKTFGLQALNDHDRELLFYSMDRMEWGGATDGGNYADIKNRRLTPGEQKALIDDGVSGGIEAAPIVFDDMIIQTPLLYGELFPLVNTIPLDRGRRIEGVVSATVTSSWGGVDDSAITLFNTNSYLSAFDTTIFRWEGAIRVGLDFLSDTPIDFGAHVTQQYGERLLEDLDDVIAAGNGSTQPEGVINKAGTTSVAFGGTTSIGNYESLRFGVAKKEHKGTYLNSAVFCGNETSYQRVRALPVGASDARRLFGTTTVGGTSGLDSYSILDRPYKINESLTNAQIFYAILGRYRMYRRRGLVFRTSTEGDTLIRNNEMLMVAMARYGGQLERGAAGAKTTTAQA